MAVGISWTPEAIETLRQNFDYLLSEWSEEEAEKFLLQTNRVISRLQLFPESYPPGKKNKRYRKARLNKHIALFYSYQKSKRC